LRILNPIVNGVTALSIERSWPLHPKISLLGLAKLVSSDGISESLNSQIGEDG